MNRHLWGFITGLTLVAMGATDGAAHERVYHAHQDNKQNADQAIYELTHPWPFRGRRSHDTSVRASAASMAADGTQQGELRSEGQQGSLDADPVLREQFQTQLFDDGKISTSRVHFDFDKDEIKPGSEPVLNTVGHVLSDWPELEIEVSGYADHTGPDAYNQDLSERRARSVREYLLSRFPKLERRALTTIGFGESRPSAPNDTREGRAQNRRVEFRVVNEKTLKRIERTRD